MKKRPWLKNLIKATVFVLLTALMIVGLTALLQPKYYFKSSLKTPETEMWNEFYSLPENDLDVLFLGASTLYCSTDSATITETTGLSAYTLASSSVRVYDLYYMLQEALRFQSPKTVVMDMGGIRVKTFSFDRIYKRTYDDMKWSSVKLEALKGRNENLVKPEPLLNRFITLMDFHTRWNELTEVDFNPGKYRSVSRGFVASEDVAKDITHDYHKTEEAQADDPTVEYLAKIAALCRERQIELVLIKAPTPSWNESWHDEAVRLAEANGLRFIDYNDDVNYPRLNLDDKKDWRDSGHVNMYGAAKFTPVLAEDLTAGFPAN